MRPIKLNNIESTVRQISYDLQNYIEKNISVMNDWTLYSGTAGMSLFFAFLYKKYKKKEYQQIAVSLIERSIQLLNKQENPNVGFVSGIAGAGWALSSLSRMGVIEYDKSIFSAIDQYFEKLLEKNSSFNLYSYSQGWAGIGLFYFDRSKQDDDDATKFLHKIVTTIIQNVKKNKYGHFWNDKQMSIRFNDHVFIGIPYGTPGITSFLIKTAHLLSKQSTFLFEKISSEIKLLESRHQNRLSLYPNTTIGQDIESRTSWMEGDYPVAILYANTLHMSNNSLCREWISNIADHQLSNFSKIIAKTKVYSNHIPDTSINSGSFGLAYINNALFKLTKNNKFKELSKLWLDFSFLNKYPKSSYTSGFYNVVHRNNKYEIKEDYGFYCGINGIGSVLISLMDDNDDLNDFFLLP